MVEPGSPSAADVVLPATSADEIVELAPSACAAKALRTSGSTSNIIYLPRTCVESIIAYCDAVSSHQYSFRSSPADFASPELQRYAAGLEIRERIVHLAAPAHRHRVPISPSVIWNESGKVHTYSHPEPARGSSLAPECRPCRCSTSPASPGRCRCNRPAPEHDEPDTVIGVEYAPGDLCNRPNLPLPVAFSSTRKPSKGRHSSTILSLHPEHDAYFERLPTSRDDRNNAHSSVLSL